MVKILKEEPDKSVIKEIVCKKCGVLLQYVPLDIVRKERFDYSDNFCFKEYIVCANQKCKSKVIIRES